MGTFSVPITFAPLYEEAEPQTVDVLVDTGATFTTLPGELLRRSGIHPLQDCPIVLANGQTETWPLGVCMIGYRGERWPCQVLFCPRDQYLLGATMLETFRLSVDPLNKVLVPVAIQGRAL